MSDSSAANDSLPVAPSPTLEEDILNAIETLVTVIDGDGKVVYVNPAVTRMFGYQPDEVLGDGWWEKVHGQDPQKGKKVRDRLARAARGDLSALQPSHRSMMYHASGEIRWIVWTDAKGPGDLMIGVGQDVTLLHDAEELSERYGLEFMAVFANSSDGIGIVNEDWIYERVNDAACRILGLDRSAIIGKRMGELKTATIDINALRQKAIQEGSARLELTFQRDDGDVRDLEVSVHTNFRPGYHLAIQRDITDRRQLERQLGEAMRLESIGRLAGGVAHDFNNMLTAIRGYAELLQRTVTEANHMRFVKNIIGATTQAAQTTQRLLAFSRKQMLKPQVVDLNHAITETLELFQRVMGEDIEVVLLLSPEAGSVLVDPNQFTQVLTNLIVNSRHAMPEGGKLIIETHNVDLRDDYVRRHIDVQPGRYAMMAVTDTGMGIPPEIKAHIFEPFFTTKEQGKGTGLGLATVHGIVKQSGGEVWVYSEPGQGSTFKIYLPSIEQEPELDDAQRKATVLVIEDDVMTRTITVQALEEDGYRVLSAADGAEALAICQQWSQGIDLVLTDVMASGMTGQDLMGYFAVKYPDLAVVHMSGFARARLEQAKTFFPDAMFLSKPFTTKQLLEIFQAALEKKLGNH